jgi:hypothetical protein
MVIYKKLVIHLDKARELVNDCDEYDEKQKKKILELYDLFEQGKWKECYGYTIRYFTEAEIRYIHHDVFRVIRNYANFSEVYVLKPE